MLSTKWDMDENRGKGFTIDKAPSFSEIQLSGYPQKLREFISSGNSRTNSEIYKFGLENGFLPKHTNEILKAWKDQGILAVISLDKKPVKGFYIQYNHERRVAFRMIQDAL